MRVATLALAGALLASADVSALAQTAGGPAAPSGGFPRTALFRSAIEVPARMGLPVERAVALAANYDLIIAKALDEEVIGLQRAAPYLRAIKARYPEKIVLDHFLH